MASEKNAEMNGYPVFTNFINTEFKGWEVKNYWDTADYPADIREALAKASKKGNKAGRPDRITQINGNGEKFLFVFEAKPENTNKALVESEHYCNFLTNITSNIFRVSLTNNSFVIIHHGTGKRLPINSLNDLQAHKDKFKLLLVKSTKQPESITENDKQEFISRIKSLNNTFRKIGLSGQDKIDFASSLLLLKEIYDSVDNDFKETHFGVIFKSKRIKDTLEQINRISNLTDLAQWFPGFSHLVAGKLIDLEKFNKLIPKDSTDNQLKSNADGDLLNLEITKLLQSKIDLSISDFDYRGSVVEEFTHGNKGGGVSKEYGEFFTPRHIVKFIVEMADLNAEDKIFDPAFGTGGFLIECFKKLVQLNNGEITKNLKHNQIFGNELHPWNVKSAKASLIALGDGHSNLVNSNFITGFSSWNLGEGNDFCPDVVVMNPPFSLGGDSTEWHFIKKCFDRMLEATAKDGKERKLISVLPYENAKLDNGMLHNHSNYLEGYISLPYGTFLKYTSVRTQIVILSTKPKYINEHSGFIEPIFVAKVEDDGYTLDNFRRPHDKNDLPSILSAYNEFRKIKETTNTTMQSIHELEVQASSGLIGFDEATKKTINLESQIKKAYSVFENTDKISLLDFKSVCKQGHFDKALWYLNNPAPTLGNQSSDTKNIINYFDVVKDTGAFFDEAYENYPYVEIGDIDIQSGFYRESEKPKQYIKEKADGEISGGTVAKKGDILISMVRTYRGAFTVLKQDSIVSKVGFLVLRPKKESSVSSNELLSMLKIELPKLVRFINYVGDGKTYPKMSPDDFNKITIDLDFKTNAREMFLGRILSDIRESYGMTGGELLDLLDKYYDSSQSNETPKKYKIV